MANPGPIVGRRTGSCGSRSAGSVDTAGRDSSATHLPGSRARARVGRSDTAFAARKLGCPKVEGAAQPGYRYSS